MNANVLIWVLLMQLLLRVCLHGHHFVVNNRLYELSLLFLSRFVVTVMFQTTIFFVLLAHTMYKEDKVVYHSTDNRIKVC